MVVVRHVQQTQLQKLMYVVIHRYATMFQELLPAI